MIENDIDQEEVMEAEAEDEKEDADVDAALWALTSRMADLVNTDEEVKNQFQLKCETVLFIRYFQFYSLAIDTTISNAMKKRNADLG